MVLFQKVSINLQKQVGELIKNGYPLMLDNINLEINVEFT